MKNGLAEGLMIILILSFHQILLGQYRPEQHKLEAYNEQFLIKQKTDSSLDTFNLVDIIKGNNKEAYLIDLNGDTINYKTFDQKVILFDFWYLACRPCMVEMPGLDLLAKKVNSKEFEIITFSVDDGSRIREKLLSKRDVKFRIIPGVSQVGGTYPFKLLLNKENQIVDYKVGGSTGENSIKKLLKRYVPKVRKQLKS